MQMSTMARQSKRKKSSERIFRMVPPNLLHRCLIFCIITIGIQGFVCSASISSSINDQIAAQYVTANVSINFTHITIDRYEGKIYVGATNWLYQFNSSLGLELAVPTGPVLENPECPATGCPPSGNYKLTWTNNINKLLVIDKSQNGLIVCGSAHQGACRTHQLGNIAEYSDLTRFPVVANDENSSTYAFIGPAPYLQHEKRALYVAVTYTRLGSYRDYVPAVCSRSLSENSIDRFKAIESSVTATSRVEINQLHRDYFIVHYKYGFEAGGYAYFVTVQRKSHLRRLEEDGYVTRLARVCVGDAEYKTYVEVTLECRGRDGKYYNLVQDANLLRPAGSVLASNLGLSASKRRFNGDEDDYIADEGDAILVAAFSEGKGHSAQPSRSSAVCMFSLADIEQKFTENIHTCYNGSASTRNMAYIAGSGNKCPEPGKGGNILDFCSETLKLNGSIPLVAAAANEYDNTTLTAITTVVTAKHTVAFVGTHHGYLKKMLLNQSTEAIEFEEVLVDNGHPILPDLHVDDTEQYVYVSTPYKISKVRIENCQAHTSCDACLGAKNPYCGWCSLEKRCTIKATCRNATRSTSLERSPSRWLSLGARHCIDFQMVNPSNLPITAMADVELTILKLPQLPYGAKYLCVFGDSFPIQAKISRNGLSCVTPVFPARPRIASGKDHVYVDLAVRSSETRTDFVHRPFAFYDCSVHSTCKSCVTSNWPCTWCMEESKCTHNASSCTAKKILGENHPVDYSAKGRGHCPSFNIDDEILVPSGVSREIAIKVSHMPAPAGFHCMIEIEGAKAIVDARIRNGHVVCAETMYSYVAKKKEMKARLTVTWNHKQYIDTTNITLYKCDILGSYSKRPDCSLCSTLDPKYNCSWCRDKCEFYNGKCPNAAFRTCPRPRIDSIQPSTGPVEGGTLITIEGSNLGISLAEMRNRLFIGDIPCDPVEYNISIRIVCRTRRSPSGELSAPIIVGNKAGITRSNKLFHYKEIQLSNTLSPNVGPQSGGTTVYISGKNLNVGSRIEIRMDDLPCKVNHLLTGMNQIICLTHRAPRASYLVQNLTLNIDSAFRVIPKPFFYLPDPTILKIQPLTTFFSGGRAITVLGTDLTAIQEPKLAIYKNKEIVAETVCKVFKSSEMMCPSPTIDPPSSFRNRRKRGIPRIRNGNSNKYQIGFVMDNVESVKNLKQYFPTVKSNLFYVPDPHYYPFGKDGIKLYKGEPLVIEGENLTLASDQNEVIVTVGTRPCNVTSLAITQLVCLPPEVQPTGTDEIGRRTDYKLPLVVIRVGHNLRFEIGYLQYEVSKQYEFPPVAVGGIATGGASLIVLSIIIMIIYRRKSTQAEREYKRIQIQMDTLESNVRSECKQAFAELQTDMTDLTTDIQASGIPTLDHKTYVMKVFFPGVIDHPILQEPKVRIMYRTNYDTAMQQFEQLLNNKYFLLTFIETLENQKSFSIRDKVNVASLLMVILMNKMEYATDILRALLHRLIDKSVGTKHPQLMLRRTESVVEKLLTNWMALCMYTYLKNHVGSSLFLLFNAIKHQLEKGPIDGQTFDARYSLSEDRLLREQVNHSWVTVQVVQDDIDEKITCKVLDCDSISQVKTKILDALYKNTPYSLRPSIYDIDLEWRHGRGGHVVLADEDITTKSVNGWRQVNTLRHYGVKDIAIMGLIPKQNSNIGSNCKSHYGTGSFSLNSTNSLIYPMEVEKGVKSWHLVKPVEDHLLHTKEGNHKTVPEIFLTRLLSTKGTVQKFVDDFFMNILTVNEHLPPAIKWLFDILDEAARRHGICDPEVVHAWKSNSLPLRFWVNFIKNPDFIFDINKTTTVDSCLSVIAQTFMDSCSMNEHRLGKDSPSNKLLFAKDIPRYKQLVSKFYRDIESLPPFTDQDMASAMQSLSLSHFGEFNVGSALKELYIYASKYNDMILDALDMNPYTEKLHLGHMLENVACTLDGEETSAC